jgi:hypothetical protein
MQIASTEWKLFLAGRFINGKRPPMTKVLSVYICVSYRLRSSLPRKSRLDWRKLPPRTQRVFSVYYERVYRYWTISPIVRHKFL